MTISAIFIAFISSLSTLALLICIAKACMALAVRILTIFTVICPMASQLLLGDLCASFSETFSAVVYGHPLGEAIGCCDVHKINLKCSAEYDIR